MHSKPLQTYFHINLFCGIGFHMMMFRVFVARSFQTYVFLCLANTHVSYQLIDQTAAALPEASYNRYFSIIHK